jgi:hypothetical protein
MLIISSVILLCIIQTQAAAGGAVSQLINVDGSGSETVAPTILKVGHYQQPNMLGTKENLFVFVFLWKTRPTSLICCIGHGAGEQYDEPIGWLVLQVGQDSADDSIT